jgi:2-polyprenyl-6-hydroxyphenyl methylase/3-demethylubiquinone-9 3-methyltransferase
MLTLMDFEVALRRESRAQAERLRSLGASIAEQEASGIFPASTYQGKRVLDLECGDGLAAAILRLRGASRVLGTDTFPEHAAPTDCVRELPGVEFRAGALADIADELGPVFDLVFCNYATEHIADLPGTLIAASRVLVPGGYLFLNHDNYYQPVGHHDHGFLFLEGGRVEPQGVRCWDSPLKCAVSAEHRGRLRREFPWMWDERSESALSPWNCTTCPYWKRSQPWAHLLYADEFTTVFPQEWFRSALNKASIFQLRQFVREAGFEVERDGCFLVENEIPEQLRASFSEGDLLVLYLTLLARKIQR